MALLRGQRRGNNGNFGKKGRSGRKGFADEEKAKVVIADFFKTHDVNKLKTKIASGKYTGYDMLLLQTLRGEKSVLTKFMDKIIPSGFKVEEEGPSLTLAEYIAKRNTAREERGREEKRKSLALGRTGTVTAPGTNL